MLDIISPHYASFDTMSIIDDKLCPLTPVVDSLKAIISIATPDECVRELHLDFIFSKHRCAGHEFLDLYGGIALPFPFRILRGQIDLTSRAIPPQSVSRWRKG